MSYNYPKVTSGVRKLHHFYCKVIQYFQFVDVVYDKAISNILLSLKMESFCFFYAYADKCPHNFG